VRWKYPVILVMVIILRLLGSDNDALQPFDHATANETGYYHPNGEAMIRGQKLPVLHVSEDDITGGIECNLPHDTGSILGPTATWQILGAFEAHVKSPLRAAVDPAPLQQAPQRYTAPHRSRDSGGAPVEADALFHHVLFLAPVPSADKRGGELAAGEVVDQLLHGEACGPGNETRNLDGPVLPASMGHGSVVTDVVEGNGGDEAVMHEARDGGLGVEGVLPRQTDQGSIPFDPLVGGSVVARVENRGFNFRAGVKNQFLQHSGFLVVVVA